MLAPLIFAGIVLGFLVRAAVAEPSSKAYDRPPPPVGPYAQLPEDEKESLMKSLPVRWLGRGKETKDGALGVLVKNDGSSEVPGGPASDGGPIALALNVLYHANMGASGTDPHAILVRKNAAGETEILASSASMEDWVRLAPSTGPGDWTVFLLPREARSVAEAAGVALPPDPAPRVERLQKKATKALPAMKPETRSIEPTAASGGDALAREARATTRAADLPEEWARTRDNFRRADALYRQGDMTSAGAFCAALSADVEPLRQAGFDLAASQVQVLATKFGCVARFQ